MNKPFSASITVDATDQIRVMNKYTSNTGDLQGLDAVLLVEDTAWFKTTHLKGNIPVEFSGPAEGNFIYDKNQVIFDDFTINKADPLTRVYFEANNSFLELGDFTNETITIEQGTLAFQNCGNYVNWDVLVYVPQILTVMMPLPLLISSHSCLHTAISAKTILPRKPR
jgi:hypothetical protein